MAGDIEEPFHLSFQADSLRSGSISFGRFETESLSWERRSSFSHNRYLEEAEKYSKPGSVTEKKAYFEEHFRRKGFPCQASCESRNESLGQTNRSDAGKISAEEDNHTDEAYSWEYNNVNEGDDTYHFDESPDASECQVDFEGVVNEEEEVVVSFEYSECQMEPSPCYADSEENVVLCSNNQNASLIQPESDDCPVVNFEHLIEVEENHGDEALNISKGVEPSSYRAPPSISSDNHEPQKEEVAEESDVSRLGLNNHVNASQAERADAAEVASEKESLKERQTLLRTRNRKQLPQSVLPGSRSPDKPLKKEKCEGSKARYLDESKSGDKDQKPKKAVAMSPSTPDKRDSIVHQSANRTKSSVASTKKTIGSSSSTFSFRSDERAEKRKEFYSKLEEKMHAKEAEKSQIQAKTMEKHEAEMRQFRKSLNFKAKPMPSFYHNAAQRRADGHKAVQNGRKSTSPKPTSNSLYVQSGRSALKVDKSSQMISPTESSKTSDSPQAFEVRECSTAESSRAKSTSLASSGRRNHVAQVKKEPNVQKNPNTVSGKTTRTLKAETRAKTVITSSSGEMLRKTGKSLNISQCSAVSVAS